MGLNESSGPAARDEVSRLLADLRAGRDGAEEALLPLVYDELRALARRQLRDERVGHTLQTTALVHEAFVRLHGIERPAWEDRAHFLRVAARAMRRVLIDYARRRGSEKRGGGRDREPLEHVAEALEGASGDLLELDGELERLSALDPRMAQVVELRFFGGLTVPETARALGISPTTVKSEWTIAKAWLKERLGS